MKSSRYSVFVRHLSVSVEKKAVMFVSAGLSETINCVALQNVAGAQNKQ